MITFKAEQNPFDLGIPQPIHCMLGDDCIARLISSDEELYSLVEAVIDNGDYSAYEKQELKEEMLGDEDCEPTFGNPLCPTDWHIVGHDAKTNDYDLRLKICQAFSAMHMLYISCSK